MRKFLHRRLTAKSKIIKNTSNDFGLNQTCFKIFFSLQIKGKIFIFFYVGKQITVFIIYLLEILLEL